MTRKHIILGRDKGHLEAERDRWLSEHPDFELLREHPPKTEQSLLARIGGKNVPQVSIELNMPIVRDRFDFSGFDFSAGAGDRRT